MNKKENAPMWHIFYFLSSVPTEMSAPWYHPIVLFGYELTIPSDLSLRSCIHMLQDLNPMLNEPYHIYAILTSFPAYFDDCDIHNEMVKIIIGFVPTDNIMEDKEALKEYIVDNVLLQGFDVAPECKFYAGIEWTPEEESSIEASELESLSDSLEEYDFDSEDATEDEDESEPESE
jgi:hypothetical protein